MAHHHLESHPAGFIWIHHVGCGNVFESLLETISELWPPENAYKW